MWEELYCFGDAFCASAWDVYAVASVVVRGGSDGTSIYTVGSQVRRFSGVLCTTTRVPGDASGVRLKSKATFGWDSSDSLGLRREGRMRLSVRVACGMRWPQRCKGKFGSQLLRPAMR